jgi:hypothetical protein
LADGDDSVTTLTRRFKRPSPTAGDGWGEGRVLRRMGQRAFGTNVKPSYILESLYIVAGLPD